EPANIGPVRFAVDPQVAWGGALLNRVQQTGTKPAPARVILLDVERAGAKLENPLEHLDGAAQTFGAREGTIELHAAVERLPGEVHPREILASRDLKVREGLVVLEVLVVPGLDILDQAGLQEECVDLAIGSQEVDVGHFADPVADPPVLGRRLL